MPSEARHLSQDTRNENLRQLLATMRTAQTPPPSPMQDVMRQWEAVLTFYRAVHWIEGRLARRNPPQGIHSVSHLDRLKRVQGVWSGATQAHVDLDWLYNLSTRVRYHCYVPTDSELRTADAKRQSIEQLIR